MDNAIKELLNQVAGNREIDAKVTVTPSDQRFTVHLPEGPRTFPLKPLDQLYETRPAVESIDPQDDAYAPLLMAIEATIADTFRADHSLPDGQVMLALKSLSMNPAAPCDSDPLAAAIQRSLRLCLSMNSYSHQEVKLAIRKVIQSVQRHTRLSGRQGYVSFIANYC